MKSSFEIQDALTLGQPSGQTTSGASERFTSSPEKLPAQPAGRSSSPRMVQPPFSVPVTLLCALGTRPVVTEQGGILEYFRAPSGETSGVLPARRSSAEGRPKLSELPTSGRILST